MFNRRRKSTKTVALALQGGASHGAFVWGVLDRLLEEERLGVEGISGTSSGAINGALVACGVAEGGREGARQRLERFWWGISEACAARRRKSLLPSLLFDRKRFDFSSRGMFYDVMNRMLVPYEFDPKTMDPLREVIAKSIDFDLLHASDEIRLFINATNVRTNKIRIFDGSEVTIDAICASCCLPFLFEAIEIDGEHYWDGGYVGNPAIYPLLYNCETSDFLLVEANPIRISETPTTASGILERINAISFTSTLMREMRTMALISDLVEEGAIRRRAGLRAIRMHMVAADEAIEMLDNRSRFSAEWPFLLSLHALGRRSANAWLEQNFDAIGDRATLDIHETFM